MVSTSWFPILHIGLTMGVEKFFILWVCVLLAPAAQSAAFGLMRLDGAGHATLVMGQPLPSGAKVEFQFEGPNGRAVCCKRLRAEDFQLDASAAVLATDEVTGEAPRIYAARIPKLWAVSPFIGAAVIGQPTRVRSRSSGLAMRDGQGVRRSASTCVSHEGVHLIERDGGSERTHLYLSVGYELAQPDCP